MNEILWQPSENRIKTSKMFLFMKNINNKYQLNLASYKELHLWSINNRELFWNEIWDFYEIIGSKGNKPYLNPENKLPGTIFFPNVYLCSNMSSLLDIVSQKNLASSN